VAVESKRPVALILSRQNINCLPAATGDRRSEAFRLAKGAYVVADCEGTPDAVLLASGSEVATLVDGAGLLAADGIRTRIVSVPSEGLFLDRPEDYRQQVLPQGIVRYGLTSGLPVTLGGLVGDNGYVHGMTHFGYSAPYKVLDQKLGFTGENVYTQVKKLIGK
jgi:transketolase